DFSSEASGLYSFHGDPTNGWTIWNLAYLTLHPDAHIAPGQGFFVASKAGGGTVTFVPEMRTVGHINRFGVQKDQIAKHVGFLKLDMTNGISTYSTDFYFNEQSTPGLDPGYDAAIFGGLAPDFSIYSHLLDDHDDMDMAVQSLPYADLLHGTVIPIGINAAEGQQLKISMPTAIIPEEADVYIEDQLKQTFTLLRDRDYAFYADANVAGTGRFFLHVIPSTLFFGDQEDYSPQLFTSNSSRMLHITGSVKSNTTIAVYDLQNRLLLSTVLDEHATDQHLDLSSLSKGMYLVKLKNSSFDKLKKILIQ
ncbi:T9SS type A sorting domain-containing protein, partial [Gelidibacter sp.]|uniref:T9SS type A sorting domain-containing protein n=1 Tax=Gelidibacter sp. TaxID=2018083 RepID=UPI002CD7BFD4